MTNPPHGLRLGEVEEVQSLYKELGDFLQSRWGAAPTDKTNCTGTSAFTCLYYRFGRQVYTGNPELRKFTCPTALVRRVGLKTTRRIPLDNGKLEECFCKLIVTNEVSRKGLSNDKLASKKMLFGSFGYCGFSK